MVTGYNRTESLSPKRAACLEKRGESASCVLRSSLQKRCHSVKSQRLAARTRSAAQVQARQSRSAERDVDTSPIPTQEVISN